MGPVRLCVYILLTNATTEGASPPRGPRLLCRYAEGHADKPRVRAIDEQYLLHARRGLSAAEQGLAAGRSDAPLSERSTK